MLNICFAKLKKFLCSVITIIQGFFKKPLAYCKISADYSNSMKIEFINPKSRHTIKIIGEQNLIEAGNNTLLNAEIRIRGHNNKLIIGSDSSIKGMVCIKGNNLTVSIGNHTTFGNVYILCQENSNVYIGNYCMFSRDIEIRTTDAHAIVNLENRKRINPAESISIGNHVWIGVGVLINKGSIIPDDSIIGAKSFVNKKFTESNTVIAGVPAKIVKTNVTWNRTRKKLYSEEELFDWKREMENDRES